MNLNRPTLIEPGVKYFLGESLKQCNQKRQEVNYYMVNLAFFGIFILFLTIYLIYKYKTRPSNEDKEKLKKLKSHYFVNKVRKMQVEKAQKLNESITNLPKFESPFEVLHKKFYKV